VHRKGSREQHQHQIVVCNPSEQRRDETASGSAGFILEHYWSFLISFFSFAEEALAFGCLPNSWTLFLFLQTSAIFFQQRTAISCSSVRFLFRIVAGFNYFTVERGVCEQRQDVGKHLPAGELCCDLKKDGIK
jgi:hypothetical protein